jgi:NAD(P)-dependent dehydrogenase (short-subunit alcohol dehydrogenase family)
MVATVQDPPRLDIRVIGVTAGVLCAVCGLLGMPIVRRLPLGLAGFCAGAIAGGFLVRGSAYAGPKAALEAMSEALAAEVASLGIKVTIVEPGPYGTDWSGDSAVHTEPISAYEPVREARRAGAAARTPTDPAVTAQVILTLVDSEQPPLRLFIGPYPYPVAEKVYQDRLATWNEWRWLAEQAVPVTQKG